MPGTYEGRCFCGAVEIRATGAPVSMGYCHCESCRSWSASPVSAFTMWKSDSVEVTGGKEFLASYNKTANSFRKFCSKCGGHVLSEHPDWGLTDIFAATLPGLTFAPTVHVHYQEAVLRIRDGLRKMKDVGARAGGSGETLPE